MWTYDDRYDNERLEELINALYSIDSKLTKIVEFVMDKQIRKIEKDVKGISKEHKKDHSEKKMNKDLSKVGKELKNLEKMDKKRDPACHLGEKMMKNKK